MTDRIFIQPYKWMPMGGGAKKCPECGLYLVPHNSSEPCEVCRMQAENAALKERVEFTEGKLAAARRMREALEELRDKYPNTWIAARARDAIHETKEE